MKNKFIVYGLIEFVIIMACVVGFLYYKATGYYDVTFSENGIVIERVRVKKNDNVKVPKSVKKKGYEIKYYLGDKEYKLNSSVNKSIVIEVEYKKLNDNKKQSDTKDNKKEIYTISFDTNGGSEIKEIKVESDSRAAMPDNPTREGYEFVEWQLDGEVFDTESKVNKNITLVAVWKKVETVPTPEPAPQPTPTPQPTPQPQPTPAPVVKTYTYTVTPVDAYSPDCYVSIYENGNLLNVKSIHYTDGTLLGGGGSTITVNKGDIEEAGGQIRATLYDGSTIIATRR